MLEYFHSTIAVFWLNKTITELANIFKSGNPCGLLLCNNLKIELFQITF